MSIIEYYIAQTLRMSKKMATFAAILVGYSVTRKPNETLGSV